MAIKILLGKIITKSSVAIIFINKMKLLIRKSIEFYQQNLSVKGKYLIC